MDLYGVCRRLELEAVGLLQGGNLSKGCQGSNRRGWVTSDCAHSLPLSRTIVSIGYLYDTANTAEGVWWKIFIKL